MKVVNVHITNWKSPGAEWWDNTAKANSCVKARIDFEFSYQEYKKFVDYIREKEKEDEYTE